MRNIHKKIELFSNIAIIIVALSLGGVLVSRYFLSTVAAPKPSAVESDSLKAGTKLQLSDIDWSKSEKTLLMVLSANCRYCTESAPFYQKLSRQKIEHGARD